MIDKLLLIIDGYRKDNGLSIDAFCEKAGISKGVYYHIKKGDYIDIQSLEKIGAAMGFPRIIFVFSTEDEMEQFTLTKESHIALRYEFQRAQEAAERFGNICKMMIELLPPMKGED